MLLRGAKTKVISEALGHASVAFTLDTYSYLIEGMQSDAMALLDEVYRCPRMAQLEELTPSLDIMSKWTFFLALRAASSIGKATDSRSWVKISSGHFTYTMELSC